MIFEAIRRGFFGISFAGILTFIALTIIVVQNADVTLSEVWLNFAGSILIGIYFGVASLLFDLEEWSTMKQTVIHFSLSVTFFLLIALFMTGWVPLDPVEIAISITIFVVIYILFYTFSYLYFKQQEKSLNKSINKS
ncbi:DUF3021 domain-containing protein [Halalkalibacillus halophilus]|uniref:DUF3021 domain-containing protein n=1 Tax=Halalkalibacillus halophilus TaxID=392827 RepID=UPI0003FA7F38|nr:DUF3021 domain-containing protein [Halalkalibacillus halophilus]